MSYLSVFLIAIAVVTVSLLAYWYWYTRMFSKELKATLQRFKDKYQKPEFFVVDAWLERSDMHEKGACIRYYISSDVIKLPPDVMMQKLNQIPMDFEGIYNQYSLLPRIFRYCVWC